jgi:hypothetical protein
MIESSAPVLVFAGISRHFRPCRALVVLGEDVRSSGLKRQHWTAPFAVSAFSGILLVPAPHPASPRMEITAKKRTLLAGRGATRSWAQRAVVSPRPRGGPPPRASGRGRPHPGGAVPGCRLMSDVSELLFVSLFSLHPSLLLLFTLHSCFSSPFTLLLPNLLPSFGVIT